MKYNTLLLFLQLLTHGSSFVIPSSQRNRWSTSLHVAGMGMGMGKTATKGKSKGKKKGSGGKAPAFNVNASLMRNEKKYDELTLADAKSQQEDYETDTFTSEFVVAVRADEIVPDWIPVAQLILKRENDDSVLPSAAVAFYCRELSQLAVQGSPSFQSVPRNRFQYSIERVESFYKYVYDNVVEPTDTRMSSAEAKEVLGVSPGDDDSTIKQKYRKLSFECHPDRATEDRSEEYAQIQLAYETIGIRRKSQDNSWYASLGGKARSDFIGPIELMSLSKAENTLAASRAESAVVGLDPQMVQSFIARSQLVQ